MQMGSPPALALEQAKDDKRRSLALSLRDGGNKRLASASGERVPVSSKE